MKDMKLALWRVYLCSKSGWTSIRMYKLLFRGLVQMKNLLILLVSFLIIYSIYFDISVGTLPHPDTQKVEAVAKPKLPKARIPYFEVKVEPGDTLMTIVEHQIKKPLPVSITRLIHDFEELNPDQSAEKIQIGKSYRFPDYAK
jgi:hypothetical protein